MHDFLKILSDLISFPSITPHSAGAIEYIAQLLQTHGFDIDIQKFSDANYQVTNLYARYGKAEPNICFAGHIDVVPPGDIALWQSDPFKATTVDHKVFGRGVVDMKGAIACMLASTLNYLKQNSELNGSISFLITSDEEGKAEHGTKQMLNYLKEKNEPIDFVILGEPTCEHIIGDTIKIGRRGSINFILKVRGVQGHVAYPDMAINPIPILVNILNELNLHYFDEGSEFFQSSNLEITSIDVGNEVTNIIPGQISAKFNIRFNDLHDEKQLIALINIIINKYTADYELISNSSAKCFIQKPIGYIAQFAQLVNDICLVKSKYSTSGGTSDARFIKDYCSVVEFGLLNETAHKLDEHTKINDLQQLYDVYYNCLNKFLL